MLARGYFEQLLVRHVMLHADHVLPISDWMQDSLIAEGVPASRMTSFPLGFDTSIQPSTISGENVRAKWGLEHAPVVIYFGDMGKLRRLEFLLRVMAIVRITVPTVRLLMVGGEKQDITRLSRVVNELGLNECIVFTGRVLRQEMPEYLAASNVGVSPIPPLPIYLISSPTKLFETLGMARPVVANDIPEQKKVLSESGGGLCVPYKEQEFAEAIVRLLLSPDLAVQMGLAGRRYVECERSYAQMAANLEQIYASLLDHECCGNVSSRSL
jgi:glycosyltransferase involved in cell wall biosynthesis